LITRIQELCRQLKPVLGRKVDRLWSAYLAESDADGKAEIEQVLELLAARHLGKSYEPDRCPFPPPSREFSQAGDIPVGSVFYGGRRQYPFHLKSGRLKEHILIAGRSGSGKTNLTFVLMEGIMARGTRVLAMDWKRGYRDLMDRHRQLQVFTIGREVAPFRFNPLIPPAGCEPHLWIKLIVDVIASAYLGGEGVISLLVAGLDHLYSQAGVFDEQHAHWPTITDLLAWLRTAKLKGRAAMWQASAERILLGMTYGEFGAVLNTQDNSHVAELLDHNVVLEMDGLSSSSDRTMFSEALTLYLYRYRLAQGPRERLTNMIILDEAHNLLLNKSTESRESVLETSIRMVRQYGLGYVFVDQSASLLSKVAFANSYATMALSQKLRSDVQTIAGAMNLSDEQREALNTLAIGTAVIRLADEHPEPFLVQIPRCPIQEGSVSDSTVRAQWSGSYSDSTTTPARPFPTKVVPPVPSPDRNDEIQKPKQEYTHPPSPRTSENPRKDSEPVSHRELSRHEIQFLADVLARPLSTTVSRYHRLNLSRRRGNAVREAMASAGIIERVVIATRSGQVVLYQLTDAGRTICQSVHIDPGPRPRESLEHRFWVDQTAQYFEKQGYDVVREHPVKGNGAIDILASRAGQKVAVEVETGKSSIAENLRKIAGAGFDRIVLVATSPAAVTACQKVIDGVDRGSPPTLELMTWLDIA